METVYIPSVWTDVVKKYPSKISAASINDNGEYFYEEKYYDADMNEITKEEYEKLIERYDY